MTCTVFKRKRHPIMSKGNQGIFKLIVLKREKGSTIFQIGFVSEKTIILSGL